MFSKHKELRKHIKEAHAHEQQQQPEHVRTCPICEKVLKKKDYLRQHMKHMHSGTLIVCGVDGCTKTFRQVLFFFDFVILFVFVVLGCSSLTVLSFILLT